MDFIKHNNEKVRITIWRGKGKTETGGIGCPKIISKDYIIWIEEDIPENKFTEIEQAIASILNLQVQ